MSSLKDKWQSDDLRNSRQIRSAEIELRKRRLKWFAYAARTGDEFIRKIASFDANGKRPRGRPKKTWQESVNKDMKNNWFEERRC